MIYTRRSMQLNALERSQNTPTVACDLSWAFAISFVNSTRTVCELRLFLKPYCLL